MGGTGDYFSDAPIQNKLGVTDARELRHIEERIVAEKSATAFDVFANIAPDEAFFKDIHRHLFEDIYDFAGNYRTVDIIHPDNTVPFAHALYIQSESRAIFQELTARHFLRALKQEAFIDNIVSVASQLNALHPFRDGNGRTIRLYLMLLADQAGYLLDYESVSATELIEADAVSFHGDEAALHAVYEKAVVLL